MITIWRVPEGYTASQLVYSVRHAKAHPDDRYKTREGREMPRGEPRKGADPKGGTMSKIEMTEKEARNKIARELTSYIWDLTDYRWNAIKDALGLEFVPEAPLLPKRLIPETTFEERGIGYCCWKDEHGNRVLDLSLSLSSPNRDRQREIVFRAFERANVYADLREKAGALESLITPHVPFCGDAIQPLRNALAALRESLEGPL